MNFEDKLLEGEFCIPKCSKCKKIIWPPAESCNHCFGTICLQCGEFKGRIIEFSRQDKQFFCLVEFEETIRVIACMSATPRIGQIVKILNCGIRNRDYFFEII